MTYDLKIINGKLEFIIRVATKVRTVQPAVPAPPLTTFVLTNRLNNLIKIHM